jgi:hypothetical protein
LPLDTQGRSRVPELGLLGSVRGRSAMSVPTANVPAQPKDPRRLAPALPLDEYKPSNRRVRLPANIPGRPSESKFEKVQPKSGRVLLRHVRPRYAAAPWPTIAPPRTDGRWKRGYAEGRINGSFSLFT